MDTVASVRPSVRDVAACAGVSVGTVSHVLNHPERVSETTRKRVEEAIASLGFVRSETARRLRDRGSSVVGVVVHDVSNPFFTEAARGIEDRLRESGCVPMLCSSDADSAREQEILSLLAGMSLRGVIIMPSATTLDRLGIFTERGIRVVLMGHPPLPGTLSTVTGDDVAGARAAVSHLLELGHRRIGFVNGPTAIRQARDRRDGVLKELVARGLDPGEVLLEVESEVGSKSFDAASGAAGAARLLSEPHPPSAIFCANDQMAIGAMREIRRRDLSIPGDVAVVGYDDISFAAELITPLTSVHQPMREMGAAAAELLLAEDGRTRSETFIPTLVVRESTLG
ncbi:LacI family DNA-binding transcriptional regulator [Actinomyces sp. ZJ308]|uniref:LacI family DNA-binding transcriptional regulator n=1 Tax=Actinomyces sp. ZJ308 TaxID=2708342 RepID=UPI001FBB8082|nr:LacI family DNA-binding transcriptional regulator [Actinomyces sp. ZJ308]